jgi:hypothetical protein
VVSAIIQDVCYVYSASIQGARCLDLASTQDGAMISSVI